MFKAFSTHPQSSFLNPKGHTPAFQGGIDPGFIHSQPVMPAECLLCAGTTPLGSTTLRAGRSFPDGWHRVTFLRANCSAVLLWSEASAASPAQGPCARQAHLGTRGLRPSSISNVASSATVSLGPLSEGHAGLPLLTGTPSHCRLGGRAGPGQS